jgi:transketolase
MRAAFAAAVTELAAQDGRILLLTGDLGFMALEPFSDRFPGRFFNVGVAEQNMVGLATGLAEAGYLPFVYSIAPFATLRPYEFIRNGPILHQLPVRIVGVGGGFEYGSAGPSHFSLEDVGVMRAQPGITIITPADSQQTRTALLSTYDLPGPIYYRLGKDDKAIVPGLEGRFALGQAEILGDGRDLLLVAMGNSAIEAEAAAGDLATQGVGCTVVVVGSVQPAPWETLSAMLGRFPIVMTVESHYVNGGIGSLVAEVIAEKGYRCLLVRCAVKQSVSGITGSQADLAQRYGVSRDALVEAALSALKRGDEAGVAQ